MSLELAAMRWLWLEQKCLVVLEERTPKYGMGLPDVLGVTPGRYLTEIEIKRSRSDFKADFQKPHRANRNLNGNGLLKLTNHPRQFYYMMPPDLATDLEWEIPDWAGLMTLDQVCWAKIIKIAPVNKDSIKLSLKQCVRLSRMMTSHMMGYAIHNRSIEHNWHHRDDLCYIDYRDAKTGTYSI